jgi:hypothetical protein
MNDEIEWPSSVLVVVACVYVQRHECICVNVDFITIATVELQVCTPLFTFVQLLRLSWCKHHGVVVVVVSLSLATKESTSE